MSKETCNYNDGCKCNDPNCPYPPREQPAQGEPSEKDACEVCHGEKGGVPGNENIKGGVVMCDYCSSVSQPSAGEKPRIHPSNFSAEEWRLVKLLGAVGGEWPWHMTDAEYKLVGEALKRVGVIKETDATQR